MPRLPLKLAVFRVAFPLSAALSITAVPSLALADCPPGAWFCADADGKEAPKETDKKGAKEEDAKQEKAADKKEEASEPKEAVKKVGPGETAQVPPGTTIIVQTAPPPPQQPPPRPLPRRPAAPPTRPRLLLVVTRPRRSGATAPSGASTCASRAP